jgi:AcrR family transcriptional regulator
MSKIPYLRKNSKPIQSDKEDIIQSQILDAARQLFQAHGRQKVTMDDVAKAMGKGRSSLYYYYKNKDEVWDAVINLELEEVLAEMRKAVEQAYSAEGKIRAFCATKIKMMREKKALYHITTKAPAEDNRTTTREERRRQYLNKESVILHQILADGMRVGELKPLDKKARDVLVFVLLSGLHGLQKEMDPEKDQNVEPAVNTLSHMIIHGLKS